MDGVGVAFVRDDVVAAELGDGRLVPLLLPWPAPFPGFHLFYPRQRHMVPAVRAFVDAVRTGPSGRGAGRRHLTPDRDVRSPARRRCPRRGRRSPAPAASASTRTGSQGSSPATPTYRSAVPPAGMKAGLYTY